MIFSSAFSVLEVLISGSFNFEKLLNNIFYASSRKNREILYLQHCVKNVDIRSFSGLYFPAFGILTERYSPYSVRVRENMDQKNSEYGHFSCSADQQFCLILCQQNMKFWCVKNDYFSYICRGKENTSKAMIFLKIIKALMKDIVPDNFRTSMKSKFEFVYRIFSNIRMFQRIFKSLPNCKDQRINQNEVDYDYLFKELLSTPNYKKRNRN